MSNLCTSESSPASLYLSRLHAGGSRDSTRYSLGRAVRYFKNKAKEAVEQGAEPDARMATWANTKVETFPWHSLQYVDVVALRSYLAESTAPASGNRTLCAMKQVLGEARKLKLIDPEDFTCIKELPRIPGTRLPKGRALPDSEIALLFEAARRASSRWHRRRNAAILAILFGGGLRRSELVRLRLERVHEVEGQFELKVIGKGNKERIVPLPSALGPVIREWLLERGASEGWFFPHSRDSVEQPISGDNFCKRLQGLGQVAGIARLTPHDGRRTFITTLLDKGVDIVIVAKLAGHAMLETTRMYDRRSQSSQKRAVERLSFAGDPVQTASREPSAPGSRGMVVVAHYSSWVMVDARLEQAQPRPSFMLPVALPVLPAQGVWQRPDASVVG
jgi:integrase